MGPENATQRFTALWLKPGPYLRTLLPLGPTCTCPQDGTCPMGPSPRLPFHSSLGSARLCAPSEGGCFCPECAVLCGRTISQAFMPGSRSRPRLSCKEHRQLPQTSSIILIAGGKSQIQTPLTLAGTSYGKGKNESFSGGLGTSLERPSTTPFSVCGRENCCLCPHVPCKGAQGLT